MGFCKVSFLKIISMAAVVLGVFMVQFEETEAMRPLQGEKWSKENLVILQRGRPTTPSGPNPCSNVPGGRGRCTLAENEVMSFGNGRVLAHAPERDEAAFPEMNVVHFAAASKEMSPDFQKQESSS